MNEINIDDDLSNFNRFINLTEDIIINCEFYFKRADFDNKNLKRYILENHQKNGILLNRSKHEIEKRYNTVTTDKKSFINYVISQIEKSINEIDNLADKYNLYHDEILPSVWYIFELRQLNVILKEWIETELLITQKSKDKKEIINKTFKSNLTPEQLEKLNIALIKSNYIPSTTSLKAFRMIFNGEPIENIEEPLKWLKTNRALAYLFNELLSKELIENRNFASVIEYYNFRNSNKKLKAGDIRTALSDIKRNGTSKELDNIDKIINKVLSDKIQIKQTKE